MSNDSTAMKSTPEPLGSVAIDGTSYEVYGLPVGPQMAREGVEHYFEMVGPRGARFLVVDYGPDWKMRSMTHTGRSLLGLTRAHLAPFGVRLTRGQPVAPNTIPGDPNHATE